MQLIQLHAVFFIPGGAPKAPGPKPPGIKKNRKTILQQVARLALACAFH